MGHRRSRQPSGPGRHPEKRYVSHSRRGRRGGGMARIMPDVRAARPEAGIAERSADPYTRPSYWAAGVLRRHSRFPRLVEEKKVSTRNPHARRGHDGARASGAAAEIRGGHGGVHERGACGSPSPGDVPLDRAIENLRTICEGHMHNPCELEVIDMYQQSSPLASAEPIIAVPTLIKPLPLPLRGIIARHVRQGARAAGPRPSLAPEATVSPRDDR